MRCLGGGSLWPEPIVLLSLRNDQVEIFFPWLWTRESLSMRSGWGVDIEDLMFLKLENCLIVDLGVIMFIFGFLGVASLFLVQLSSLHILAILVSLSLVVSLLLF